MYAIRSYYAQLQTELPVESLDQPQLLVLDQAGMRERLFFENLRERVITLLDLLPERAPPELPLQPLPVIDLIDELVDQHLVEARRLDERP